MFIRKQTLHSLKNKFIAATAIMILMVAGFPVPTASAAVCTSTSTGLWSSAATWSCGYVPTVSDDVVISAGDTVTVDTAAVADSVTVADGSLNSSLTIGGANTLTVTYDVNVINTTSNTTKLLNVGAGTLNIGGNLNFSEGAAASRITELAISTGTATVNGNITINAGGTLTAAQVVFSNTGTLNVGGTYAGGGTFTKSTGTVNFDGAAQTIPAYAYNNLTLSGSGVKTLQAGTAIGGILTLTGTASATTAANLTVASLNVGSGTTFTNSSNYTLIVSGATSVGGTLNLASSNTPTANTFTGNTTIDGTLNLAGSGGTTFTGVLTIDPTGTYDETAASAITNSNNLVNNGTYIANSGTHTFGTNGRTISGLNPITIPTLTLSGSTTISGALRVPTALTTSAAITVSATGSINTPSMTIQTGSVNSGTITTPSLTVNAGLTNNGTLNVSTTLAGSNTLTNVGTLNFGGFGSRRQHYGDDADSDRGW